MNIKTIKLISTKSQQREDLGYCTKPIPQALEGNGDFGCSLTCINFILMQKDALTELDVVLLTLLIFMTCEILHNSYC
jgi:hypothetical protein